MKQEKPLNYEDYMSYSRVNREKSKRFNTNMNDMLNKRGKIDLNTLSYTMDLDCFEVSDEIQNIIDTLDEREQIAIRCTFFEDMNYRELSEIFNLSVERTRQIVCKSLRKLRHPMRNRKLKEILGGAYV